jgi:hypothetical protein
MDVVACLLQQHACVAFQPLRTLGLNCIGAGVGSTSPATVIDRGSRRLQCRPMTVYTSPGIRI